MNGKLILTPVVNTRSDMDYIFGEDHLRGSFWSKDALLKYDYMQIDAYNGMDHFNNRDDFCARDRVFIFSDASGKKLADAKSGIAPETVTPKITSRLTAHKVIEWQLGVANAGTTLGVPLNQKDGIIEYKSALKESVMNAEIADNIRLQTYSDFKLFAYVDGFTYPDLDRWVTEMNNNVQVDGYSFVGKCVTGKSKIQSNIADNILAIRLGYMLDRCKGKPLHITGSMNREDVLLLAYANKYLKTDIYLDTMLHHTGKAFKRYADIFAFPYTMAISSWKQHPTCPCPVCRFADNIDPMYHTYYGILASLHNLFVSQTFIQYAESLVNCDNEYLSSAQYISDSLANNMRFIDCVAKDGFEKAYCRYFEPTQDMKTWVDGELVKEEKNIKKSEKADRIGKIKVPRGKK